jgi:hypothetical protein
VSQAAGHSFKLSMSGSASAVGEKPDNVDQKDWEQLQQALGNGFGSGISVNQLQSASPDSLGNDPKMEMEWAEKAGKHAETYFKLLKAVNDKSKLKLTPIDAEIYTHFRTVFPDLNVKELDEEKMKSNTGKALWRPFCMKYEKNDNITDYNFGTLLRLNANHGLNPDNITVVPRIQFLTIEIARNKEGANIPINKDFKEDQ